MGRRPRPYLARRGLKWIRAGGFVVDGAALRNLIACSHRLVAAGLTREARRE
jgi:predicted DNA-binding protein (MmcQ/YjbR family)